MANTIRLKRASGSDPGASDLVTGEVAIRTDTGKIFTKKDDNSVVELGVGISNVVEDTSPQLGGDLQSNGNDIDFADNDKAIFGTGSDLQIYHSGTNSLIDNNTGDLVLRNNVASDVGGNIIIQAKSGEESAKFTHDGSVELRHDNVKKFETLSTGVLITGSDDGDGGAKGDFKFLQTDGTLKAMFDASASAFEFYDNTKAVFGNGDDLQLYHDGSNSYIVDNGTGGLIIGVAGTSTSGFYKGTGSEPIALFIPDGAVELYHNNSKKFETTSSGLNITGDIVATGDFETTGANDHFKSHSTSSGKWVRMYAAGGTGQWDIYGNGANLRFSDNASAGSVVFDRNVDANGGLDVTGNISVSGTVDGRDVATDGTKLDGIESGATADQSASEIVALIADQTIAPSTIDMEDSEKILLGTSDDLQIFHDGSNSHIHDNGTGQLRIRSNAFRVNDPGDSENMIKADINGAVSLFFDDSQKFFTSSTGVSLANGDLDVNTNNIKFGHCSSSGSDDTLMFGTNGDDLKIFHGGAGIFSVNTGHAYLRNTGDFSSTRKVYIMAKNDEESVTCNSDGSVELYYDNSKKFETFSTGVKWHGFLFCDDNSSIRLGNGADLQIYHDGSNSYIKDAGTGQLVINSNEFRLNSEDNSQQMIGVQDGGSVDLYHNGSQKLQTTSSGVKITGDVLPDANNSRDLGSSSLRWQNLFVNDMHFANSPDNPNKVDGTWGDWTLQEGEATIYMLNNRNGKKYKMNLTEV